LEYRLYSDISGSIPSRERPHLLEDSHHGLLMAAPVCYISIQSC
jgi:hypothetical protein